MIRTYSVEIAAVLFILSCVAYFGYRQGVVDMERRRDTFVIECVKIGTVRGCDSLWAIAQGDK